MKRNMTEMMTLVMVCVFMLVLILTCDVMTTMKRPNIKRNMTTSKEVTQLLIHLTQPILSYLIFVDLFYFSVIKVFVIFSFKQLVLSCGPCQLTKCKDKREICFTFTFASWFNHSGKSQVASTEIRAHLITESMKRAQVEERTRQGAAPLRADHSSLYSILCCNENTKKQRQKMKLPTGIRVLCLNPKKERGDHKYQQAVSDCTLPCSEEKLGKYSTFHCWQFVKYLETHFGCRSFISTPSQFTQGLHRFFQSLKMSLKKICFMQIHKPSLNRGLCRHN